MKKKIFVLITTTIFLVFFIIGFVFTGQTDNRLIFTFKNNIPLGLRVFLKDNVFFIFSINNDVKKLTSQSKRLNSQIEQLENQNDYLKNKIYAVSNQINDDVYILPKILEKKKIVSNNNEVFYLTKYFFHSKAWQYNQKKPSGYLVKESDKIFTISGDGKLGFFELNKLQNEDHIKLNKIKTNLKGVTNNPSIYEKGKISFRGMMINENRIYLSYYKKVKDNCFNISILDASLNLEILRFKEFFTYDECSENMSNHTGGKMIKFNQDTFLFTIGDAQQYMNAQSDDSLFGKLIQINYSDKDYKILAKGMRDTQGGIYNEKDKIVLMTEHGPTGGDEINSLKLTEFDNNENFGWPIASYGTIDYIIIEENQFFKHKENGFKEPLHWFRGKSVAPSQIIYVDSLDENTERNYFLSAMGNVPYPGRRSIHHLRFDSIYSKLEYSDIIPIGERIRDIINIENEKKVVMILENSPSLAILEWE